MTPRPVRGAVVSTGSALDVELAGNDRAEIRDGRAAQTSIGVITPMW